jgi:prepilin signal peptidase PulO-like enzyme (type II secretory pathway)
MRLILRFVGTWLIALALVLLVIDGTKSLGANALVLTSLADLWTQLHPDSLVSVQSFFDSRFFEDLLDATLAALLGYPAFAVIGLPGIILALLGRKPRRERFLRQDQI